MQAELAEWWLVHPVSAHDLVLLAEKRPGHTVVWLDEIQNYLGGDNGLGASTVRALLGTPDPIILVGTIWPQRYAVYTAFPKPNAVDQYFRERDVLKLADAIFISPQLSAAEQQRARGAAIRDQRIRIALDACEHGLTRTLAAAPLLVARWEGAETDEPYAWAVITAALDAARLGATQPLTAKLLSSAAPGYCASRQLADAPTNWFRSALAYATQKVHGAAAALEPEGARMNSVTGYAVADYLLQQSIMTRRTVAVPASLWDALAVHGHSCDLGVIARAAESRGLVRVALNLYEAAAASGDSSISAEAGMMLGIAGRTDDAISWYERGADAGDMSVFVLAGGMLEQVERIDEALVWYRRGAHLNDYQALDELVRLLERTRRQDEAGYWRSRLVGHPVYARLRAGIKNGNEQLRLFFDESRAREESYYSDQGWTPGSWQVLFWKAIMRNDMTEVASALAGQADLQEEYLAYLRRSSDAAGAEECEVSRAYIDLLTIYNRVEIAEAWLRQRIDVTGAGWMILRLARLLGATGRIDEALVWYDHTSIVDGVDAMVEAAELLGKVGRIDEALRRFYRASMSGCREGLWGAVRLLRLAGRVAHADSLQRYGWSAPTGSAARPWQISVHEIARTQATP
ncbi:MAG: hypothetical protein JXA67_19925 [Micromonosporaceae bacterium]|nr:hypothetical protein [Micromonosporaceae bacterium]